MPYTLQNCFDRLQHDILDDPNERRFTDARCHRALIDALAQCQRDLSNNTVPLFAKYEDLTTTAAGVLAFTSFADKPLRITKIAQRLQGSWQTMAQAIDPIDQLLDVTTTVDVRVHFYPQVAGPSAATDVGTYLFGGSTARGDADDSFELWVIYEAALKLRRLDASGQGETKLHQLRNEAREQCLEMKVDPTSTSRRRRRRQIFNAPLRWYRNNDELIFSR